MELPKGTIIICPKCETPQLVSTKDLKAGGKLGDACWESLGFNTKSLSMACFKCGAMWSRLHPQFGHSQIHIKGRGWIATVKKTQPPIVQPAPETVQ